MTHDQVLAEAERLEAEYASALKEMQKSIVDVRPQGGHLDKDGNRVERTPRFLAASQALVDFRQFWRQVGESVNIGHPGRREGIKITNNDGSAD